MGRGGLQAPRQGVWGAGSLPVRTILWTQNLAPLGIEVEKQGFRTAWLIKNQKFP